MAKVGKTKFTIPRTTVEALLGEHVKRTFTGAQQLGEFTIRKDGSVEMELHSTVKEPELPLGEGEHDEHKAESR